MCFVDSKLDPQISKKFGILQNTTQRSSVKRRREFWKLEIGLHEVPSWAFLINFPMSGLEIGFNEHFMDKKLFTWLQYFMI